MRILSASVLALLMCLNVAGQSSTPVAQPGQVVVEPPTTTALGVEWRIQGDDNRNALSRWHGAERARPRGGTVCR